MCAGFSRKKPVAVVLNALSYRQALEEEKVIQELKVGERNSKNGLALSQNKVYSLFCPYEPGVVMMPRCMMGTGKFVLPMTWRCCYKEGKTNARLPPSVPRTFVYTLHRRVICSYATLHSAIVSDSSYTAVCLYFSCL